MNDLFIIAPSSEKNGKCPMLQDNDLLELTVEQQTTVDNSFKTEYLKDEMLLNKMFDYDFDDLDD